MNTTEFFDMIYPDEGVVIAAVKTDKGFRHRGFSGGGRNAKAAAYIKQCDEQGLTVYHACGVFQKLPYKEGDKLITRGQPNWLSAKAFWADIDCGADKAAAGHGYATQKEGALALFTWCKKRDLPYPTLVNSGRGIHAYWVLSEPLAADAWVQTATRLKALMAQDGLLADPTRTADFSSVLRPVGSFNRKDPANPKEVKLARPGEVTPTSGFISAINRHTDGVDLPNGVPDWVHGGEDMPDYREEYTDVMCSAETVAAHCAQVALMRDTQGDVEYEQWRGVIGIVKHCKEGEKLAEAWTSRRAETGHTNVDWKTRFETWTSPPPTCDYFARLSSGSLCKDCPHRGKIKTPWVLGREAPEPKAEVVEAATKDATGKEQVVAYEIPPLPNNYMWDGSKLVRMVKNSDGVLEPHAFCYTRFYLYTRLRDENGLSSYGVRAHLPRGEVREFTITGALIGVGGSKLMEALGQNEILASNSNDSIKNMTAYLKDEVGQLMTTNDAIQTFSHFGWQDNGAFLIGSRLYRPDGSVTEVQLSGGAMEHQRVFPRPTGSIKDYAGKINAIYNRAGMEPLQYAICSLWAAPIAALCDSMYAGIPVVLSGTKSGKGKTTAAMAALFAYGRPQPGLMFSGREGATTNAQANFLGVLRNLPVLFDEVTNKSSKDLSDLCYALSSGVEKMRLRSAGGKVTFNERQEWRTHTVLTGNTAVTERLATNGDTEAEVMRIFEIGVDSYQIPKLDPMAVMTQVSSMNEDMGAAGDVFIRYVVANRQAVRDLIFKTYDDLKADADLMAQPRYRFYRNHMCVTLAGAKIMQELGVHKFNIPNLTAFALEATRQLTTHTAESNVLSCKDVMGQMLNELAPRIINTLTYDIGANEPPYQVAIPSQGIVGRSVRGSEHKRDPYKDNRLYLSATVVREWCVSHRVSIDFLAKTLAYGKVLLDRQARITLGKNTSATTTQCRCWEIDLIALENYEDIKDDNAI